MSLREWLIAIGTLVILGIIIDGIRRVRRARKESMAISSGMGADDLQESPLDEEYNPELPNGGARTVSRETLEERGYVKSSGRSRFANPEPKPTRPVIAAGGSMAGQERAAVTGAPQADSLPVADDRQDESHDDWQEEVAPGGRRVRRTTSTRIPAGARWMMTRSWTPASPVNPAPPPAFGSGSRSACGR